MQDRHGQRQLPVLAYASDDHTELGEGTLLTPDNTIDTTTGTIRLKATFPNKQEKLWPGQFINAHLQIGTAHDAVTIPPAAIEHGPDGLYVYVVKPDATIARRADHHRLPDRQTRRRHQRARRRRKCRGRRAVSPAGRHQGGVAAAQMRADR